MKRALYIITLILIHSDCAVISNEYRPHLLHNTRCMMDEVCFSITIFVCNRELCALCPNRSGWDRGSHPKPDVCIFRHCPTIDTFASRRTVITSTAFGTVTKTALKFKKEISVTILININAERVQTFHRFIIFAIIMQLWTCF